MRCYICLTCGYGNAIKQADSNWQKSALGFPHGVLPVALEYDLGY